MPTDDSKKKPEEQVAAAQQPIHPLVAPPAQLPAVPPTQAPAGSKFIVHSNKRYVVKPNQYDPGGWLKSPGLLEIFKATQVLLLQVAKKRGMNIAMAEVEYVQVGRNEHEQKIYMWPTDDAENGIPIKRYGHKTTINLIKFLAAEKLCVEKGYQERYVIKEAGPESPAGPAVVFDMEKPVERKPWNGKTSSAKPSSPDTPPTSQS